MKNQTLKNLFSVALNAIGNVVIESNGKRESFMDLVAAHGKEDSIIARWIWETNALGVLVYDANLLPLVIVRDDESTDRVMVCFDDDAVVNFTPTEPAIAMSFILHAGLKMFNLQEPTPGQGIVVTREDMLAPMGPYIDAVKEGDVISALPLMYKVLCDNALSALRTSSKVMPVAVP